jgi:hypothetical protein
MMALITGIWILDLTHSVGLAAIAGIGVYAPQLLGPWLGGLADRIPRRPLVVGVDLLTAACLCTLFAVRTAAGVPLLFAVTVAYGMSLVVRDAADTAILTSALPAQRLAVVNGWRSSAQEGMKIVAPLAGAGLYAWRGGPAAVAVSAAALAGAGLLFAGLRLPAGQAQARPRLPGGARAALRAIGVRRELLVTVALAATAISMAGFQTAGTYAIVVGELRLPPTFLGVLGAAQGAGSIMAGLYAGRLIGRTGVAGAARAGALVFGLSGLLRCVPWWPATVFSGVLAGFGLPWALVAALTAVQLHAPRALLGRVAATADTVMFGPIALAFPLGAWAVALGPYAPLLCGAGICLTAAGFAWLGEDREVDRDLVADRRDQGAGVEELVVSEDRGPRVRPA